MTAERTTPPEPKRPVWRRRVLWAFVAVLAAVALALVIPSSPWYLPTWHLSGGVHDGRITSSWVRQLRAAEPEDRITAIMALGTIGAEGGQAVPALAEVLEGDEDVNARVQAALALAKMAPASRPAVPALTRALDDHELQVRMNAAHALSRLGPDARAAIPALTRALEAKENRTNLDKFHHTIHEMVVIALGRVSAGTDEAVPTLIAVLKAEGDDALRAAAARALGEVGESGRAAVPVLKDLLQAKSRRLRESVEEALTRIEPGAR